MPLNAVRYGLVGAAVSVSLFLVVYLLGISFTSYWWVAGLIRFLLTIFFIILAIKSVHFLRRHQNKTITFTDCFGTSMVIFLIIIFANISFNLLLYNVLDKEYAQKTKVVTIERLEKQLNNPFINEDMKVGFLNAIEAQSFDYKTRNAVSSLGYNVFFYMIIATIIAAGTKKDISLNSHT